MRGRAALALVAMCAVAHAQQLVCEPCQRGDDTISQLPDKGQMLRIAKDDLLGAQIHTSQITRSQQGVVDKVKELLDEGHEVELLAEQDTAQLTDIAASLCNAPSGACVDQLHQSLDCVLGRCEMLVEHVERREPACDATAATAGGGKVGLGFEWASGWQDDASPVDHRAWSFGFEARTHVTQHLGFVGRLDRSTGRDAAIDNNGDHRDDLSTGPVTRVGVLAGPSYSFLIGHDDDIIRFAELDLLGGYQWTLSKDGENGLVAGADLSYQLAVARIGLRATQGTGDADQARAVVAHVGFMVGASPRISYGKGCDASSSRTKSRLALALDIPIFGYGLSKEVDYIVPGLGIEGLYHAASFFDLLVRGDLLDVPGSDRDRTIYQSLLAGGRIDLGGHTGKSTRSGVFTTLAAGYSWAAATAPTTAGSGPIVDVSIAWGAQGNDGAAYLRLHGRFGVTPDNYDARAIFLSAGMELRLDRHRWDDRL